jgi:hypothetical protein
MVIEEVMMSDDYTFRKWKRACTLTLLSYPLCFLLSFYNDNGGGLNSLGFLTASLFVLFITIPVSGLIFLIWWLLSFILIYINKIYIAIIVDAGLSLLFLFGMITSFILASFNLYERNHLQYIAMDVIALVVIVAPRIYYLYYSYLMLKKKRNSQAEFP